MSATRWTVLIVDDSPDDRAEIRRLLIAGSERRLRLVEAATGTEALAAHEGVDAVVLDNRLPDTDALGVLRALGGGPGAPTGTPLPVPVLVLTGDADVGSMCELLQAGAMDYLGKRWMTEGALVHALEGAAARHALLVELAASRAELERARCAAEASRRRAEDADRRKSEFLARMSHEIRTPIAAIIGYAELLEEHVEGAEAHDHLGIVRRSADALLGLVDEILDLSRIEAGAVEVERAAFAPHALLGEVVDLLRLRASDKGVALHLEFASMLPESASSDANRLRQILVNLVGNAVKFTDAGSVRVVAGCGPRPADPDASWLTVEVIDTGMGVPPESRANLFEPFNQADRTIVHRFGGTGLGLAISRRLARLLGGELELDDARREGSRFVLVVPVHAPGPLRWPAASAVAGARDAPSSGADPGPAPGPAAPASPLARVRALVVDDREEVRALTAARLRAAGARVDTAADGLAALGSVGVGPSRLDLIVMDVQMPGMDGFETVRRLRAAGCTTPVLALTANAMAGDRERCLAAGCDDYLSKPVSRERLIGRAAALARPAATPVRRVLVVDDERTVCLMLVRTLSRLGHEVRHALDCEGALAATAAFAPEVVVTDLELPDGDGRALARQVRSRLGRDVRVIALSGHRPRPGDPDADFDARFVKPVEIDVLAAAFYR